MDGTIKGGLLSRDFDFFFRKWDHKKDIEAGRGGQRISGGFLDYYFCFFIAASCFTWNTRTFSSRTNGPTLRPQVYGLEVEDCGVCTGFLCEIE